MAKTNYWKGNIMNSDRINPALEQKLEQAYIDQERDLSFHEEIAAWDCTVGDGLEKDAEIQKNNSNTTKSTHDETRL